MQTEEPRQRLSSVTILLILGGVCGVALLFIAVAVGGGYYLYQQNQAQVAEREKAVEEQIAKVAPPPPSVEFTEQELIEFAAKVEKAAIEADMHTAATLIDGETFTNTVLDGLPENVIVRNVRRSMVDRAHQFLPAIFKLLQGGSYQLVRIRYEENRPRLIFRLLDVQGNVNYHELLIDRKPGEPIRIVDLYIYATGEFLTQTMRRAALVILAHEDRTWVEKFTESEQEYVRQIESVERMIALRDSGDFAEAMKTYATLSPSLQANKNIALLHMQIAQNSSERDYMAALEAYRKAFPNDPSLAIYEIDYYVLRKEYDQLIEAIGRLDELVGGDMYLDSLFVGALIEAGRLEDAKKVTEAAIENAPDYIESYWHLASVGLAMKDNQLILETLKRIDERFETEWVDFGAVPEYAEFAKSPEHEEWLLYLALKGSEKPAEDPAGEEEAPVPPE